MRNLLPILFVLFCFGTATAQLSNPVIFESMNNPMGLGPTGLLTRSGSYLYGLAPFGGPKYSGLIFRIDTNGTGYTDLYNFDSATGEYAYGSLVISGTNIYGSTSYGSANNHGCIFTIKTNGTGYTILHNFDTTTGVFPSSLTLSKGLLFGTTNYGGTNNDGVIFSIDTLGHHYKVIMNFNHTNGSGPLQGVLVIGHNLYGLCSWGGPNLHGLMYSIDSNGSGFRDLYNFSNPTGMGPAANLCLSGNKFYGTTFYGGSLGHGTVFGIDTDGIGYKVLHNFDSIDGTKPQSTLTICGNLLYGTCKEGGGYYVGTYGGDLFSIDTSGTPFTKLWSFNDTTGAWPMEGVIVCDKYLWGTAATGGDPAVEAGVIYRYPLCNNFTIVPAFTWQNVSCHGGSNGIAMTSGSGGPNATYLWSNGNTDAVDTGLAIGTYTVIISNPAGCSARSMATITQPTALKLTDSLGTKLKCFGDSNGIYKAYSSGGTSPYYYSWSDGNTTFADSALAAGTYTITTQDFNGCTTTLSITIIQPTLLTLKDTSLIKLNCFGDSNGKYKAYSSGGTSPYNYVWSDGSTTNIDSRLSAGTYTITSTDAKGCSTTLSVTLTEPAAITVLRDSVSDGGSCNGLAAVKVLTGVPPYTYKWSPGGQTTDTIKNKCHGTYCCTVTDKHGCTEKFCIDIRNTTGIENVPGSADINIYPDPNSGNFILTGLKPGQVVSIENCLGQNILKSRVSKDNASFDLSSEANGVYLLRIINADGIIVSVKKILKQ